MSRVMNMVTKIANVLGGYAKNYTRGGFGKISMMRRSMLLLKAVRPKMPLADPSAADI